MSAVVIEDFNGSIELVRDPDTAEKLFDENFHKCKLIGVREYGIRALKKTAG